MTTAASSATSVEITSSHAPRAIKFGLLCTLRQSTPRWFGTLCFIIFQLQTLALLLRTSELFLDNSSYPFKPVVKVYIKILTLTDWSSYENNTLLNVWAPIIIIDLVHLMSLVSYINYRIWKRRPVKEYIQAYWNIICYFHPLVTFFPIHTFCLQVLQKISEDSFNEPVSSAYTVIFILCLVGNFWLSFASTHIYHLIIKTKDPLSSKNNYLKGKDIAIKSIVPILWTYSKDTPWLQSFIIVVLFLDAISKDFMLFHYLPYYHVNLLEICASMQGAQTALASAMLLTRILTNTKLGLGNYFVLMCWFVLIPILAKMYRAILWRIFKKILTSSGYDLSVYYLIHKGMLLRYLMKNREVHHKESTRIHHTYLMFEGIISSLIEATNGLYDRKSVLTKETLVKNLKYFYEGIVDYHPDSDLAKVTLAHYYVKYEGAYLLANNLIEEVMKGIPRFATRLSLSLIQYQLQKKLLKKYSQEGNDGLNILKYVQTNMVNNKLKQRMKKQVKLQLEFWANFLSNQPDMGKLVLLSQRVDVEKSKVNKAWKEVVKLKSLTFASPLLLYGVYISYVSNNAAEGEKYMEKYHTVAQKLRKIAQSDELNNDTIMFEDTIQISMSGSKTKIGRILDCSTNIEQGLGWKKNFIIGRPIILIMPPYYKSKHDRFLLNHYNTGEMKIINKTDVLPVMASDGFIRPTSTHIKMNPLVEQGISYIAVLRPLKHPRRMILVRKDGTIDAMSKDFALDMNISPQQLRDEELNVFNFCPDFRAVNTVFNMMASNTMKQLSPPHTPRTHRRGTHRHQSSKGGGATLGVTRKAANSLQVDKLSMIDFSKASERALQQMDEETGIGSQQGGLLSSPGGQESGSKPLSLIKEGSFHMNRSPNRAASVFENYSQGAKLVFHPQRDYVVHDNKIKIFNLEHHHSHQNHHPGVTYNVQIINKVHGTEFIKIVYLEKVHEEDPDHHEPSLSYMTNQGPQSQPDGMKFSFNGRNTMREHSLFKKESVTDRALISPNSQDLTNHQSILSPHNNLLSSTKRFFIKEEQEEKEEDHQNNSDTMDVFDENPSQLMVRDNVLGHEGILSSSRDNIFLSSARLLKNGIEKKTTGLGQSLLANPETPKTAVFYGCELTPEGEKFDLLAKMKTATFERENMKAIMENVKEHNTNHNGKPAENSVLTNQSGGGTGYEGEDNDILRLKLRRLKDKFNTAMINKVRKESSVGSSYLSKEKKVQKLIAKVLNMDLYKKSARIFIYCYVIYITLVLVIESVQASTIFTAIDGIEGKISVVKNGVFRLRSLINVSKYSTMLNGVWTSGLSLFDDWDKDNSYVLTNLGDWVGSMNTYNENLMEQVSQIDTKYQYAFFEKNVRMYERDSNDDLTLLAVESNFEAIGQILDKGIRIVNMEIPANSSVGTDNTDLRFIIDNAFDDLLLSCESTALALAANLRSGLDKVQNKMLIIYGFLIAMAVLFFFACLRYLMEIRSNSKLFMNMFFRLSEDEVGQSKDLLEHFLKVLETNVHHIDMEEDNKKPSSKAPPAKSPTGSSSSTNHSHNQRQKAFRKASMDGLYRQQFKQFGMLTPIYLFIIMINLGYLLLARNTVTQILKEEAQIEASLKSLYQQTLVVAEFFELILTSGQTTVRNNNIVTEFEENLAITKNVDGIVENFRNKNGDLTPDQQNAFYSFACEDFNYYNFDNIDLLLQFCPIVGNGQDQVGLVAITLELYTLMTYYYDLYDNSDKTLPSIRKIFIDCIGDVQGPILLSQALWNILYDATELSFHSKTRSIRNQAVAFTIVILLLMFLGAVVLWARVIKRIFLLERIDRNVLQMVPIRIILANRFLKQYLLRNADGMLDSVRKFL